MGMKFYPRLGLYKAGANCTFNPTTKDAYSYGWWRFVSYQHGKLIFNDYYYSPTTRKHQSKVRELLRDLGLTIDVVIESPRSIPTLQKKSDLTKYLKDCESERLQEIEEKRLERNRRARARRVEKKLEKQRQDERMAAGDNARPSVFYSWPNFGGES